MGLKIKLCHCPFRLKISDWHCSRFVWWVETTNRNQLCISVVNTCKPNKIAMPCLSVLLFACELQMIHCLLWCVCVFSALVYWMISSVDLCVADWFLLRLVLSWMIVYHYRVLPYCFRHVGTSWCDYGFKNGHDPPINPVGLKMGRFSKPPQFCPLNNKDNEW